MAEPGVRRIIEVIGQRGAVDEGAHQDEQRQDGEAFIGRDFDNLGGDNGQRGLQATDNGEPEEADGKQREAQWQTEKKQRHQGAQADQGCGHSESHRLPVRIGPSESLRPGRLLA